MKHFFDSICKINGDCDTCTRTLVISFIYAGTKQGTSTRETRKRRERICIHERAFSSFFYPFRLQSSDRCRHRNPRTATSIRTIGFVEEGLSRLLVSSIPLTVVMMFRLAQYALRASHLSIKRSVLLSIGARTYLSDAYQAFDKWDQALSTDILQKTNISRSGERC